MTAQAIVHDDASEYQVDRSMDDRRRLVCAFGKSCADRIPPTPSSDVKSPAVSVGQPEFREAPQTYELMPRELTRLARG